MNEQDARQLAVEYVRKLGYDAVLRTAQRVEYSSLKGVTRRGSYWLFGLESIPAIPVDYVDSSSIWGISVDEATRMAMTTEEHLNFLFMEDGMTPRDTYENPSH